MNSRNTFKCPVCKEYTQHVRIGMRESTSIAAKNEGITNKLALGSMAIISTINDLSGLTKAATTLMGVADYKCCKCGTATRWNSDGSFDSYI